jgi:hypothetical protein
MIWRHRTFKIGAIIAAYIWVAHTTFEVKHIADVITHFRLDALREEAGPFVVTIAVFVVAFAFEKWIPIDARTPQAVEAPRQSAGVGHYLRLGRATIFAGLIAGCVLASRLVGWHSANGLLILTMALGLAFLYVAFTRNRRIGVIGAAIFGLVPAVTVLWNSAHAS